MGAFKKYDGSVWQSINPKQLKGIPYTGTLPAVLTGTKAGYLHKYKIYGNTEQASGTPTPENPIMPSECGERTENLFDESTLQNGYYDTTSYQYYPNDNYRCFSLSLPVGTYTIFAKSDVLTIRLLRVSSASLGANPVNRDNQSYTFTLSVAETIYVSLRNSTSTNDFTGLTIMLNLGLLAPPFEPYGYKLPLLSGSTPVDIYIGDDTLSTEEYVDSGTGKIYRIISGTLTPVDPPVPFPQIPTSANSTTITWAGQGLAPSQFDSIQEWVDIPTYKRVNGEWVADN